MPPHPRETPIAGGARVIPAAIALVTLVGIALSTINPVVALEMERWGISSTIAGLTATLAGLGTIVIVPLVPALARRHGVRALLAISIVTCAGVLAAFPFLPSLIVWALLRFLLGAALGVLFTLSEFWINAAADPARRGLVMGVYATTLYVGFASGPAILALVGTSGPPPYLATAAIMLLGLVPLALAGSATPELEAQPKTSVLRFMALVPVATLAAFVFGAVETGMFTQLPVHYVRIGFSESDSALLLSAFTLGNVLFQLPLGALSDRMDRRMMLFALALVSGALAAALPFAPARFLDQAALLFLLGGISGAIYPVGLAHLGQRFSDADLAAANGAFVMLYSAGLMVGPPLIGLGMDAGGAHGLPVSLVVLLIGYAGIVALRMARQGRNSG